MKGVTKMPINGEIKSLYLDRNETTALFPRTKTKAVSNDKGVSLEALLDEKATQSFVTNKIAEAQFNAAGGNVDLSGFVTKDDLAAIDFPVDSVNGKTGVVTLTASDVEARESTWLPTVAEIGAAPAGYGLGSVNGTIVLDLDDVTLVNGVYNIDERTANKPSGITYGHLHVLSQYANKVYIIYNKTAHGGVVKRQIVNGTAYDWEWFNPPMTVGVEYRTTERYLCKPVYCRVIDFGAWPTANTSVQVDFNTYGKILVSVQATGYSEDNGYSTINYPSTTVQAYTNIIKLTNSNSFTLASLRGCFIVKYVYN